MANAKKLESVKETTGRKKISTRKVDLANQKPGFTWQGRYMGLVDGTPFQDIDKKTGEVITKTLKTAIFEDAKAERTAMIADKGLQSALTEAMVSEGQWIEVVKLEKQQISKGRSMNQYDVFAIDPLTE